MLFLMGKYNLINNFICAFARLIIIHYCKSVLIETYSRTFCHETNPNPSPLPTGSRGYLNQGNVL